MKLGTKLKELRESRGFKQNYVASCLGMDQGNYSKLENDHHLPSLDIVEKIAKFYGIPSSDLVEDNYISQNKDNKGDIQVEYNTQLIEIIAAKDKLIEMQDKLIVNLEEKLKKKD